MKIIEIETTEYPHRVLKCLSCSIGGKELETQYPEEVDDVYTAAQLGILEKMITTHGRLHTNANIVVYDYRRQPSS